MLRMRHNNSTGTSMETMMMMPPMVGTPFLFTPKGSIFGSRSVSKIFFFFIHLMNHSPNHADIINARISVSIDLKEMYDHRCEPGMSYWSNSLKR